MTLRQTIQQDLIAAMKGKEEMKVSVLRMLKSAIMKFEVSGTEKKEASNEDVLQIIGKEVKQRKDSIDAYEKGGRADLAQKEKEEMALLQAYLPAQMSDEELLAVVQEVVAQTGATSKPEFGKVMGALMGKVKGKADGQRVKAAVEKVLK